MLRPRAFNPIGNPPGITQLKGFVALLAQSISRLGSARSQEGACSRLEWWVASRGIAPHLVGPAVEEHTHSASNAELALLGGIPGKAQTRSEVADAMSLQQVGNDLHRRALYLLEEIRSGGQDDVRHAPVDFVWIGREIPTYARVDRQVALNFEIVLQKVTVGRRSVTHVLKCRSTRPQVEIDIGLGCRLVVGKVKYGVDIPGGRVVAEP